MSIQKRHDRERPNGAVSLGLLIATTAVVILVFAGDLLVPMGAAGGVLYVIAILLSTSLPRRWVYGFAVVCTALTVLGYFTPVDVADPLAELANRAVAIFAIWVAALLGLHRRRLFQTVHEHDQIIDQVQDAVITLDMAGTIRYWNSGAETVFGYSADEIIGESVARIYRSRVPEITGGEVISRLLAEGSIEVETMGVNRKGEEVLLRQWLLLRRDESNQPSGVILHVSDITRRRESERAAMQMEAFYQDVLDELPLQVAIFDPEGRFLYLNPASLSSPEKRAWILGRTEREYFDHVGRNLEIAETRGSYRQHAIETRSLVTYEEDFETQTGETRSFLHGFFPMVGSNGEVAKVLGYRYDITDHKRTAWALHESLARLKAIVDTAGDGIITIQHDGTVESANRAAQRLFGFEPREAIGKSIDALITDGAAGPNDDPDAGYLKRILSISSSDMGEFLAHRKDGTTFPAEVATSRLQLDDQAVFTAIIRDLTNRKRADRAVRRYAERVEAFRQMDQAILTASSTREVTDVAIDHLAVLVPAGNVCIALFDTLEDVASVLTVHCEGRRTEESVLTISEFLGTDDEEETIRTISRSRSDGCLTSTEEPDEAGTVRTVTITVPLVVQDTIIGMLRLGARNGENFSPEDIDIAKEVAGVFAIAINDARLFEEIDASRERLQALSHRLVEVQEQERRLIARELHDEIGQALTGLKFSLETLEAHSGTDRIGQVEEARRITLELLGRVRDLSLDLRPAMLDDLGLLPALLWLTERYSNQTGLEVTFKHRGLEPRLDPEVETAAYRIVQEALTNVARHAGRAQVDIVLMASDDTLVVRVKDDGVGFNLKEAVSEKNSSGLSGMSERASLLGGTFDVETKPGRGTTVTAEFPLSDHEYLELAE